MRINLPILNIMDEDQNIETLVQIALETLKKVNSAPETIERFQRSVDQCGHEYDDFIFMLNDYFLLIDASPADDYCDDRMDDGVPILELNGMILEELSG